MKHKNYGFEACGRADNEGRIYGALDIFEEKNITKKDPSWWKTLGYIWSLSENLSEQLEEWNQALSSHTSKEQEWFMGKDNSEKFKKLPETLEIFRGFPELDLYGMSYSLDKQIAIHFARRGANFEFEKKGKLSRGSVAHFSIAKKYTFAFMNDREEQEIIVLKKNWKHLKLLETPSFHWVATPKKKAA